MTAVDISPTALAIGAAAQQPGDEITWIAADLAEWQPPSTFDLVTSCFLHSEVEIPRGSILRRAATAVAPGGTLLIVGHSGAPHWPRLDDGGHTHPRLELPTPDDVYATLFTDSALDPQGWSVLTSALVERVDAAPDGTAHTIVDSVLTLRRNE